MKLAPRNKEMGGRGPVTFTSGGMGREGTSRTGRVGNAVFGSSQVFGLSQEGAGGWPSASAPLESRGLRR